MSNPIDRSDALTRDFTHTEAHKGYALSVRVEHPSWTHPDGGLWLGVTLTPTEQPETDAHAQPDAPPEKAAAKKTRPAHTMACRADLDFARATVGDALSLFESVGVIPCRTCSAPAFDPKTCNTNRDGECEACFLQRLQRDFDRETLPARIRELKADIKRAELHKAKGFTHHLLAMIHPASGDDFTVEFFAKGEPPPEEIKKLLKKRGSQVLDDYRLSHIDVLQTNLRNALVKAEADKAAFAADKAGAKKSLLKAERDAQQALAAVATSAKRKPAKPPKGA